MRKCILATFVTEAIEGYKDDKGRPANEAGRREIPLGKMLTL